MFATMLANSLAGCVNLSSIAPDTATIATAGSALAMGVGGEAAAGLKLKKSASNTSAFDLNTVVEDFT